MKAKLIPYFVCLCSFPLFGQDSIFFEQKAPMPTVGRDDASGFAINNAGFIGFGSMGIAGGFEIRKDLWKYDPMSNSWIEKESLPAPARQYAMSFSYNNNGYILGGHNSDNYFNEMWTYNESESWFLLDNLPAGARAASALFIIDDFLYFGTGRDADNYYQDFWKYDLVTNEWSPMPDFPGGLRFETVGYALNGLGYIGMGRDENFDFKNDIWTFDPVSEEWSGPCYLSDSLGYSKSESNDEEVIFFGGQKADLSYTSKVYSLDESCSEYSVNHDEIIRRGCASFRIESDTYFFGGLLSDNIKTNELLKISVEEPDGIESDVSVFFNENGAGIRSEEILESIMIYDLNGRLIRIEEPKSYLFEFELNNLSNGVYLLQYFTKSFSGSSKLLINSH